MKLSADKPEDLPALAAQLIGNFPDRRIFAFHGEMGAGKTTFIKAICAFLGVEDATSSPTFSLVNEYRDARDQPVFHFDFYRIRSEAEAFDMGFEEYVYSGNYCFIEWPEKIPNLLPPETLQVYLRVNADGRRTITVS